MTKNNGAIIKIDFRYLAMIKELRKDNHTDAEIMQLFGLKFGTNPERYFRNFLKETRK